MVNITRNSFVTNYSVLIALMAADWSGVTNFFGSIVPAANSLVTRVTFACVASCLFYRVTR